MILVIFIVSLFAISAVSANDNATATADNYNARIIAKDITEEFDSENGNSILFNIVDLNGNAIYDAKPKVTYDNKKVGVFCDDEHYFSKKPGTYVLDRDPKIGTHKVKIELNTTKYLAKSVFINVKITDKTAKLTLKKYVTTDSNYAFMKATVKDSHNQKIDGGTVKFKVNGKTYSVKVNNGVAIKKIKLRAKTYTYKATFTSKNYLTKTVSSKLYIKKTKSYYTLKIRNSKIQKTFKVSLPYKKYVKLLTAKNNGRFGYAEIDTGISRPPDWGGGHYCVGLSTNDNYLTHYDYELGDYLFLRASSYLCLKKINLYTANF